MGMLSLGNRQNVVWYKSVLHFLAVSGQLCCLFEIYYVARNVSPGLSFTDSYIEFFVRLQLYRNPQQFAEDLLAGVLQVRHDAAPKAASSSSSSKWYLLPRGSAVSNEGAYEIILNQTVLVVPSNAADEAAKMVRTSSTGIPAAAAIEVEHSKHVPLPVSAAARSEHLRVGLPPGFGQKTVRAGAAEAAASIPARAVAGEGQQQQEEAGAVRAAAAAAASAQAGARGLQEQKPDRPGVYGFACLQQLHSQEQEEGGKKEQQQHQEQSVHLAASTGVTGTPNWINGAANAGAASNAGVRVSTVADTPPAAGAAAPEPAAAAAAAAAVLPPAAALEELRQSIEQGMWVTKGKLKLADIGKGLAKELKAFKQVSTGQTPVCRGTLFSKHLVG